jgi:hypothetical protein
MTFSHVAVRLAFAITAIPGFFEYDYDVVCAYYQCSCTSTETSLREKQFQGILSRMIVSKLCNPWIRETKRQTQFFPPQEEDPEGGRSVGTRQILVIYCCYHFPRFCREAATPTVAPGGTNCSWRHQASFSSKDSERTRKNAKPPINLLGQVT